MYETINSFYNTGHRTKKSFFPVQDFLQHMTYSLHPQKSVVLDFCTTSLTQFVENMCNIYISK